MGVFLVRKIRLLFTPRGEKRTIGKQLYGTLLPVVIAPTYPQSKLRFTLDDYGKKGSLTFRFSGGDTPSAGTGC